MSARDIFGDLFADIFENATASGAGAHVYRAGTIKRSRRTKQRIQQLDGKIVEVLRPITRKASGTSFTA